MIHRDPIPVVIRHADPVAREGLRSTFGRCSDLTLIDSGAFAADRRELSEQASDFVVVADHGNAMAYLQQPAAPLALRGKVLVIASACREWEIRSALECGVRGYVVVGCGLDELTTGVRALHRGQRYLSPQIALQIAEILAGEALTLREEDVLRLLVDGLSNKLVARRLDIAVGTVKSHLKAIFDKLGVQSRTQAICAVERRGLLRERSLPAGPGGEPVGAQTLQRQVPTNRTASHSLPGH